MWWGFEGGWSLTVVKKEMKGTKHLEKLLYKLGNNTQVCNLER